MPVEQIAGEDAPEAPHEVNAPTDAAIDEPVADAAPEAPAAADTADDTPAKPAESVEQAEGDATKEGDS
ncbi:hypothetical protein [Nitriliruptor alkaliphilus]|uniref:hypothetical protein n=1 Tax=Nitriliruptor alkaliphilus TaxID=427918 RepID=UPI003CCB99DD